MVGIAERRVLADFQTELLPAFLKQIEEAAGHSVPVEVRWETMTTEGESHLYVDSWKQVYFEPLIAALKDVARDDLGKEALKNGLKKIVIQNTKKCYYPDCFSSFADGALTLDHEPTTNVHDVAPRTQALIKVLENSL
jgi:hypothetical protein